MRAHAFLACPSRRSIDTSASPTPSSVMASAMSNAGFGRNVSAAALHRFLIARREGAQRVLDAVAELPEHRVGNVERILRDEIDADALRADQPHDLLDLLQSAWAHRRRADAPRRRRTRASACRDRRPRAAARTIPTAATAGTSRRACGDCISLSAASTLTMPRPSRRSAAGR